MNATSGAPAELTRNHSPHAVGALTRVPDRNEVSRRQDRLHTVVARNFAPP